MELMEQLECWFQGEGYTAKNGYMPATPDRAVAVYATDLRDSGDPLGSGVLIHVRGERQGNGAMTNAVRICRALNGFEGLLVPDGGEIVRVETEMGPGSAGLDSAQRPFFAMTLRVFW